MNVCMYPEFCCYLVAIDRYDDMTNAMNFEQLSYKCPNKAAMRG